MSGELRTLILRRLREHEEEIRSLTSGLTSEQLRERPGRDRWSLHEIAMHLAETQDLFSERVARILVEDLPGITPFQPDTARREGSYRRREFAEGMASFGRQRTNLLKLLASLSDEQWRREGVHPEIRHYSIERCMESLMRHEEHHLYGMFNIFFGIRE